MHDDVLARVTLRFFSGSFTATPSTLTKKLGPHVMFVICVKYQLATRVFHMLLLLKYCSLFYTNQLFVNFDSKSNKTTTNTTSWTAAMQIQVYDWTILLFIHDVAVSKSSVKNKTLSYCVNTVHVTWNLKSCHCCQSNYWWAMRKIAVFKGLHLCVASLPAPAAFPKARFSVIYSS